MRKLLNFGLWGILLMSSTPAGADPRTDENAGNIKMLRSQAIQAQLQGDPDGALTKYQMALSSAKQYYGSSAPYLAEIYYDMGSLCLDNSKFTKAVEYLNQALTLNPNSSAAHLRLSELMLLQSHGLADDSERFRTLEAAKNHARLVLAKHKFDVVAHKDLASAYELEQDSRQAYREYADVDDIVEGRAPKFALASAVPISDGARKADEAQKAQQLQEAKRKEAEKNQEEAKQRQDQKKAELETKKKLDAAKKKDQDAAANKKKADQKKEHDKLEQEKAKKKAEAKKKTGEEKKKAPPAKQDAPVAADAVGLPATLTSKAVLLTPVKKKPAAVESSSVVPVEPKKALVPLKPIVDEDKDEAKSAPAAAKKPAKAAEEPKAEAKPTTPKPAKHAPGLVPPPPPVMTYPTMAPPQPVVATPKPKPQPKKEEKPKEQPAAKEDKPDKSEDEGSDFMLDWAGAKAKPKKK